MRKYLFVVTVLLLSVTAFAQDTSSASTPSRNVFGFGASYDAFTTPHVTGAAFLGKQVAAVSGRPTYSITSVEFSALKHPRGALQTSVRTGVGQVLLQTGLFRLVGVADAGVAAANVNAGLSLSAGGVIVYGPIKRFRNWSIVLRAGSEHSAQTGTIGKYWAGLAREF